MRKKTENRKRYVPPQTRAFAQALGLMMATMTCFRFLFFIVNRETFSDFGIAELGLAFLNGAKFDLHVVLLLTGIFFLVLHVPGAVRTIPAAVRKIFWLPLILFLPLAALSILDIHYYTEAGRHLSYEIAFVTGESYDLRESLKMVAQYRFSIVLFIILAIFLVFAWKRIMERLWRSGPSGGAIVDAAWLVPFLVFTVFGQRGAVFDRPLRMCDAFVQGRTELGHLVLNPQFTVGRSLLEVEEKVPAFYSEDEAVEVVRGMLGTPRTSWYGDEAPLFRKDPVSRTGPGVKYNVVLIVLESWSPKYIGAYGKGGTDTPGFDRLAKEGILFRNFYSVGNRTDEGLASLCLGVPSFNRYHDDGKGSVLSGSLEQNRYAGLGSIFGEKGYSTVYLHGESSKVFRQASLARLAGFGKHLGSEDLGLTKEETSGPYGGWDHVLFGKLFDLLAEEREPFAVLWMSLTNHSPYSLPDDTFRTASTKDLDGKFRDSIRYTDHHLGLFFEKAREEEYFNRTIFVITADHSTRVITSLEDRYQIPLLIYAPGILKSGESLRVGSQTDLIPTLLDILGFESHHHAMGRSLLEEGTDGFAFLNFSNGYGWISSGELLEIDPDGRLMGVRAMDSRGTASGDSEKKVKGVLSYLQLGRKLLLTNRFVPVP